MRGGKHHQGSTSNNTTSIKKADYASATTTTATSALDGLSLIQRGNEYFFSDCYLEATGYYYQAAMLLKQSSEHRSERSKAWSNVAECHLRLQNWQAAEDAATNAILAEPTNTKALYRRAKSRFELGDYNGAAKDADAVGTQDAMDVAALCRELAHADVARKLTIGGTALGGGAHGTHVKNNNTTNKIAEALQVVERERRGERRQQRRPSSAMEVRDPAPQPQQNGKESAVVEREMWFRRIIDSYRLRVDDEYAQTGASDAGCLYGIQAKGLVDVKSPMDHFQSYVNRAIKKRVLPNWFTVSDMEELCQLATSDTFSNINIPVTPEDIMSYYVEAMGLHNALQELRDLAVYIEGPIGMPWKSGHNKPGTQQEQQTKPVSAKPNIVLESTGISTSTPSWSMSLSGSRPSWNNSNRHRSKSPGRRRPTRNNSSDRHSNLKEVTHGNRPLYELSGKYPSPAHPRPGTSPCHPSTGEIPYFGNKNSQYSNLDKRENRPPYQQQHQKHENHHRQPINAASSNGRLSRASPPTPAGKRNPMYPYHHHEYATTGQGRHGQRPYDHHGYSPSGPQHHKKRGHNQQHLGWTPQSFSKAHHNDHHHRNRYGLMFSEETTSPTTGPISDTDSTPELEHQLSYGPQIPYNLSPSAMADYGGRGPLPNTHSARQMMMSLMHSIVSDDDEEEEEYTSEYDDERKFGEFYSQDDTSTAQEVRHGLWPDHRDEFSDLTERSP